MPTYRQILIQVYRDIQIPIYLLFYQSNTLFQVPKPKMSASSHVCQCTDFYFLRTAALSVTSGMLFLGVLIVPLCFRAPENEIGQSPNGNRSTLLTGRFSDPYQGPLPTRLSESCVTRRSVAHHVTCAFNIITCISGHWASEDFTLSKDLETSFF